MATYQFKNLQEMGNFLQSRATEIDKHINRIEQSEKPNKKLLEIKKVERNAWHTAGEIVQMSIIKDE